LTIRSIDFAFYEKFTQYLIDEKNLVNNSVGSIIKNLKSFLNHLSNHGHYITVDLKKFKVLHEKPTVIYHTEEEINRLKNLIIPSNDDLEYQYRLDWKKKYNKFFPGKETLEKIRDLHLLACSTGYRISDIKRLGSQHKGAKIIKMTAHKNKNATVVPLNPVSSFILEKYNYNLPSLSDQRFNDYVKALCFLAGITQIVEIPEYRGGKKIYKKYPKYELITSHVAVSTFITICGQKGVSAKTVSSITGKTVKVILDHYYGSDEKFIESEMAKAFGII
jgi:integrase